ncbi:hypothetical protein HED49_13155 [Ochrobactrum daejeonense]|nr:hypothetical protein [Brucella daejeonensis]
MNMLALRSENDIASNEVIAGSLPALVLKAANQLAAATTAAEVLEAKASAGLAYDAAKATARFAKAKGAYEDVIGAVYRAQADALEIEAMAKRRLADEYDAAQERGEVAKVGEQSVRWMGKVVADANHQATLSDLGIRKDEIHSARSVRDAESRTQAS